MNTLEQQVRQNLTGLLPKTGRLILGVSGGADSIAMLHLVSGLVRSAQKRILVIHINHGLRARSSDLDEQLVLQTAGRLGIKAKAFNLDIKTLAKKQKKSIEETARLERQVIFINEAKAVKAKAVLLAQHKQDQVETFLWRLMRGAGIKGLAAMAMKRPFPHHLAPKGLWLIRPLLNINKESLMVFLKERRLKWREDKSNCDINITRNRIRHELLPYMARHFNSNIEHHLFNTMESLNRDFIYIEKESQKAFDKICLVKTKKKVQLNRSGFKRLDEALQWHVLSLAWDKMSIPQKSTAHLEEMFHACFDGHPGLALPGRWMMNVNKAVIQVFQASGYLSGKANKKKLKSGRNVISALGIEIETCSVEKPQRLKRQLKSNVIIIDHDKVSLLSVRAAQPGDTIQAIGMNGKRKEVKKILSQLDLDRQERTQWPVILNGREIIWVWKGPIADKVKITGLSKKYLKISIKRI